MIKTGDLSGMAFCTGCDWTAECRTGSSAVGHAAKHHNKTGHTVQVEIARVVIFQA